MKYPSKYCSSIATLVMLNFPILLLKVKCWSYFAREGEQTVGTQGNITEEQEILRCLKSCNNLADILD